MKKSRLIIILSVTVFFCQAQIDSVTIKRKGFEMGATLFSIQYKNADYRFEKQPDICNYYVVHGAYLRFYSKQHGLRFALNYYQNVITSPDEFTFKPETGEYGILGKSSTTAMAAGYQYFLSKGVLVPFVFGDLVFKKGTEKGSYSSSEKQQFFFSVYERRLTSYALHSGLGLRLLLGTRITLTYEAGVAGYLQRSKNQIKNEAILQKTGITFYPCQISFGLKF